MKEEKASPQRSRLDEELMPRRDFLGICALGAAISALGFAFLGILRLPKAAVLPSVSKRFKVTLPESFAEGDVFVPPGHSVAILRTKDGVEAISTVCTHLGCIVHPTSSGFECPCHGSKFKMDGTVLKGPAPKALPRLAITKQGENQYLVDEGKVISS